LSIKKSYGNPQSSFLFYGLCKLLLIHAVVTPDLHQFVIKTKKKEWGGPLTDEKPVFSPTRCMENQRGAYGAKRRPQPHIRRKFRGLLLNHSSHSPFRMFLSFIPREFNHDAPPSQAVFFC
jgi:hypothetical protein